MNDYTTEEPYFTHPQTNNGTPGNYIDEDEKKSMAILNLQAILGMDDVDKVIELLQQNNWDESVSYNKLLICDLGICVSLL